jgi:hypothetical protein
MATDAWGRVRATTAQLLGRKQHAETEAAARDLDTSYPALQDDKDEARTHLRVLLHANLKADPALCRPLEDLASRLGPAPASASQHVKVGRARNVSVAGRDIRRCVLWDDGRMGRARNGEIELEYETFGPPGGRPLLLIAGMVAQLTMYPVAFCEDHGDQPGAGRGVGRADVPAGRVARLPLR